jgi:2-polyprenyl-3-methyl-5-hydroxy-6-metoxy-1,4-benzoquinol methylase
MTRKRFCASPNFALNLDYDGRAFLAQDCEPYAQYWLDDNERLLFALLMGHGTMQQSQLASLFKQASGRPLSFETARTFNRHFEDMLKLGVIMAEDEDTSRYTNEIAEAYLTERPFPAQLTRHIVDRAGLGEDSRILDLAGGPGDLAVQLAAHSPNVSLMELSRGFLDMARQRADRAGLRLQTLNDSCNRLMQHDGVYDVISIAQALHWMDDVQLCRGVITTLQPGGDFFVVHSALTVDDAHPLSFLLGNQSILGAKSTQSFEDEARAITRRLQLVFSALEQTVGRPAAASTQPVDISLFRQSRPLDMGFARAFMTERHIAATNLSPEAFWLDIEQRLQGVDPAKLTGVIDWAVLHFHRGEAQDMAALPPIHPAQEIDFQRGGVSAGPVHPAGRLAHAS